MASSDSVAIVPEIPTPRPGDRQRASDPNPITRSEHPHIVDTLWCSVLATVGQPRFDEGAIGRSEVFDRQVRAVPPERGVMSRDLAGLVTEQRRDLAGDVAISPDDQGRAG